MRLKQHYLTADCAVIDEPHIFVIVFVPTRVAALSLSTYVKNFILRLDDAWKDIKVTYAIGGDAYNVDGDTNIVFCTGGK